MIYASSIRPLRLPTALEWCGCATGLIGAALVASNTMLVWWGFVAFMASNLAWIGFALLRHVRGLLVMQLAFAVTSMFGLVRFW